jgi:type I restriction enzyme S subunit
LQHFGAVVDAPNGVQKLRELILQLAVRGKLVPQDPSEEPASMLLEKIAAEEPTGRSVSRRSPEAAPEIFGRDQADLPEGWTSCLLSDVALIEMGNSPPGESYNTQGEGIPLINGPTEFSKDPLGPTIEKQYTTQPTKLCDPGDLLICVRGATTGRTNIAAFRACIGRGVALIRACVHQPYVNNFVLTSRQDIFDLGSGSTFPSISYKHLANLQFALPPLTEQRRIVEKVDKLMALCEELDERQRRRSVARAWLNRASLHRLTAATDDGEVAEHWQRIRDNFHRLYDAPETVAELRQAILQMAVRGKLVPQNPSDEPAAVLLERIEAERERLYKEGRIGQPKDLPPIEFGEVPFEVPDSWEWVRFGELQEFTNGFAFQSGDYQPDGIGIIRIGNLANGAVDTTNMKRVPARLLRELDPKLQVRKGDLLIGMSGSIGKVAFSTSDETFLLNQRVGRIAPILMDKFYIYYFLRTTEQQYLEISFGSAIKNLSTEQIRTTAFPLPPLVEQRRIVEKVDQLMALCDELEAKLTRSRTKAESLASAVVHHLTAA